METVLAILAGGLTAMAVWLMLSGNLLRFLFGLLLLSNGVNLAIFAAGRLTEGTPAFLPSDGVAAAPLANSLPQALLLTAIVIGFGLFAFALALTIRAYRNHGHLRMDDMQEGERP